MIGFDSPFNPLFVFLWAALTAAVAVPAYIRMRGLLRPGYLTVLILLRLAAIAIVMLLLFHPFYYHRSPDNEAFHVAVLADASASMKTRDCSKKTSRLEVVQRALAENTPDSLVSRLRNTYNVETALFTDKMHRYSGQDFSTLPGNTAIGKVLNHRLNRSSPEQPLGAVVLLTDGHNNEPPSATTSAQRYRQNRIPVTAVGIGDPKRRGEIRISVPDHTLTSAKGKRVALPTTIHSTYNKETEIEVSVQNGFTGKSTKNLVLPGGGEKQEIKFNVKPLQSGLHTYKVKAASGRSDPRPGNNVDYISVNVREPETYRLLYLGTHLTWEHRFLKRFIANEDHLQFNSVIRTSDDTFKRSGPQDSPVLNLEDLPTKSDVFNAFHGIILSGRTAAKLNKKARKNLRQFVDERGGGLVCTGPLSVVPEDLRELLPASKATRRRVQARQRLHVRDPQVFPQDRASGLLSGPGPYLPAQRPAYILNGLKPGARRVLERGTDDRQTLLSVQRYGSGRTACFGMETTWLWYLAGRQDRLRYESFWRNLLNWLCSSSRERLQTDFHGRKFATDKPVNLGVDLLSPKYRPAQNADVSAIIHTPEGETVQRRLLSKPDQPGHYTNKYTAGPTGEYRVHIRAEFPNGETLNKRFSFAAVGRGKEQRETAYQEGKLRDMARLTGGKFVHYSAVDKLEDIPLSPEIPMIRHRKYWLSSWFFLLAIVVILGTEWFFRRRIGLR